MLSHRQDYRTLGQFKEDIYQGNLREIEIAVRFCLFLKQKERMDEKSWPTLETTGCGMSGELLNDSRFNCNPDFSVGGIPTEMMRSDCWCKEFFHIKEWKVEKCLQGDFDIVFVNGFITKNPVFVLISPEILQRTSKRGLVEHPMGSNKKSYRYDLKDFSGMWNNLPEITVPIPQLYKDLLENNEKP